MGAPAILEHRLKEFVERRMYEAATELPGVRDKSYVHGYRAALEDILDWIKEGEDP